MSEEIQCFHCPKLNSPFLSIGHLYEFAFVRFNFWSHVLNGTLYPNCATGLPDNSDQGAPLKPDRLGALGSSLVELVGVTPLLKGLKRSQRPQRSRRSQRPQKICNVHGTDDILKTDHKVIS